MPLREFTQVRAKARDRQPRLGVQKNGRVSLNASALDALDRPSHVVLLFDPETMEFAVRKAHAEESHSYRLGGDSAVTGRNISAVALWRHFGIDFERYRGSYRAREEDMMLVIRLGGQR
jgi:hypothetical protein